MEVVIIHLSCLVWNHACYFLWKLKKCQCSRAILPRIMWMQLDSLKCISAHKNTFICNILVPELHPAKCMSPQLQISWVPPSPIQFLTLRWPLLSKVYQQNRAMLSASAPSPVLQPAAPPVIRLPFILGRKFLPQSGSASLCASQTAPPMPQSGRQGSIGVTE